MAPPAYYLKRGLSVAILEKGHVACEQSSRNWWIGAAIRNAIAKRTAALGALHVAVGRAHARYQSGSRLSIAAVSSYATHRRGCARGLGKVARGLSGHDVETRMLSRAEVAERVSKRSDKWVATYSERDGKANLRSIRAGYRPRRLEFWAPRSTRDAPRGRIDLTNGKIAGVHRKRATSEPTRCFRRRRLVLAPSAARDQFPRRQHPADRAVAPTPTINIGKAVSTSYCTITRRLDGSYTLASSGKANLEDHPPGYPV